MPLKKHIIENTNGTDKLFSTPSPFMLDSVSLIVASTNGTNTVPDYSLLGNKYIQFADPPPVKSNITIFYNEDLSDQVGVSNLSPWEAKMIENLLGTVYELKQMVSSLEESLSLKVGEIDFSREIHSINKEIKSIKSLL